MSTTSSRRQFENSGTGAWSMGIGGPAGVLLATVAVFQILEGLAALFDDNVYVAGLNYVYQFDLTTWGWIHLIIGIIGLATGLALVANQAWANVVGIVLACLGAISNFAFLPYYPFWSMLIIAFNVLVMWALTMQLAHD
jgi:hypothetical protein